MVATSHTDRLQNWHCLAHMVPAIACLSTGQPTWLKESGNSSEYDSWRPWPGRLG